MLIKTILLPRLWLYLIFALLVVSLTRPTHAQDIQPLPDAPDEAARIIYDFLLNAPPDQQGIFLERYLCLDYDYPVDLWNIEKAAQGDTIFSLQSVEFKLIHRNRTQGWARLAVIGQPEGQSASGTAAVAQLPSEIILTFDGAWRLCPNAQLMQLISPADQALDEVSALDTAQQFYYGFYTALYPVLETITCLQTRPNNIAGTSIEWAQGFEVRPAESQWSLGLVAQGYDFQVVPSGQLQIFSFQRDVAVTTDDRYNFPDARLIRQNGWKFCAEYRPGDSLVRQFAQDFFGEPDPVFLSRLICRQYRDELGAAGLEWNMAIQTINIPPNLWRDENPADDRGVAGNLAAVVVIGTDGTVVSLGQLFGPSARFIKEANQWRWCQPLQGS